MAGHNRIAARWLIGGIAGAALLAGALHALGLRDGATTTGANQPASNFTYVDSDDHLLKAAITSARSTIGTFWAEFANPGAGVSDFTAKVAFPTRTGTLEHIWVGQLKRDGRRIAGRIFNDPRDITGLKAGSEVSFDESEISDWAFQRNGKMVGNATMRVLVRRLPPEQAKQYLNLLEAP